MYLTLPRLAAACVLAVGTLAPLVTATPAHAATGSTIEAFDGRHWVRYVAGSGQVNNTSLEITNGPPVDEFATVVYTVHDVAPITPGTGCYHPDPADPSTASCDLHAFGDFNPLIFLHLGDRADRLGPIGQVDVTIYGGPGNDVLIMRPGGGSVYGEDGDDIVVADSGDGGEGDDRVSSIGYGSGGPGNDTISGTDDPQQTATLVGGSGNDTINGGPGQELVYGDSVRNLTRGGPDLIRGGQNRDIIYGGLGPDTIYGNSGDDHIEGGPATDILSGGPGNDVLRQ